VSHRSSRFVFYAKLFLLLEYYASCSSYNAISQSAAVQVNLKKSVPFLTGGFPYLDNLEGITNRLDVGALSSVRDGEHCGP